MTDEWQISMSSNEDSHEAHEEDVPAAPSEGCAKRMNPTEFLKMTPMTKMLGSRYRYGEGKHGLADLECQSCME